MRQNCFNLALAEHQMNYDCLGVLNYAAEAINSKISGSLGVFDRQNLSGAEVLGCKYFCRVTVDAVFIKPPRHLCIYLFAFPFLFSLHLIASK